MRSGHKSNAVCTVIMKHFNAQSEHSPKLRDNITYSISVMDRHCSRSETSHFVDSSPLISVHDITTCMNCTRSLHNSGAIKKHAQAADSLHFSLHL